MTSGDAVPPLAGSPVDLRDQLRPGQAEEIVIALQWNGMIRKALTTEIALSWQGGLDHRAHGSIDHQDAL